MPTAAATPALPEGIKSAQLMVGLEVHVELATRSKMFTRVGSPACAEFDESEPNTLIDPVTLALPGACLLYTSHADARDHHPVLSRRRSHSSSPCSSS